MVSGRSGALVRTELVHTFPVPVGEGFAYITDIDNWAQYWPGFVRIQDQARVRWREPGDEVTLVMRLLAREVELNMTLGEFREDSFIRYTSRQWRLPDARHERYFEETPAGFESGWWSPSNRERGWWGYWIVSSSGGS